MQRSVHNNEDMLLYCIHYSGKGGGNGGGVCLNESCRIHRGDVWNL